MKYLVMDLGLYVEQANALWKNKGDKVWYWTPWASAFPKFQEYSIGKDFEHIEKILYFWDKVEEADCIVNFDVHNNDLINFLRKIYPDKSIFGSGLGERLENDRWGLKKILREVGMKIQKSEKLHGVHSLKEYLKKNTDKFVKVGIFRGDVESFYAKNYDSVELRLDEIEATLGMFHDEYDFICEEKIDTDVEVGYDGFFNGIDYIKPYIYGYEYHKGLYIGRVSEELPIPLKDTMDRLKPILRDLDWRGAISTEEKVLSPIEHYFLDVCSRLPAPLSSLYPECISNWSELIYKIGKKQPVRADIKYKYVGAFPLESTHAKDNYLKIDLENKNRDKIKLRMACGYKGKYFACKGMESVAVLVAGGNSVDEVISKLKDSAKYVDAYGLDKDGINGIEVVSDIIEKGKKNGIPF